MEYSQNNISAKDALDQSVMIVDLIKLLYLNNQHINIKCIEYVKNVKFNLNYYQIIFTFIN